MSEKIIKFSMLAILLIICLIFSNIQIVRAEIDNTLDFEIYINEEGDIKYQEILMVQSQQHNIYLSVYEYNKPAIRCYKKAGFKEVGRLREAKQIAGKR